MIGDPFGFEDAVDEEAIDDLTDDQLVEVGEILDRAEKRRKGE